MNIILLDADVIIDLHRLNLWKTVTKRDEIHVSSIICREAFYYDDVEGKRHTIDLLKEVGSSFIEVAATLDQLLNLFKALEMVHDINLDPGEKEALAILQTQKEMLFCTCDRAAMKALGYLGINNQGISFEKLLERNGIKKRLLVKHLEYQFKRYTQEGIFLRLSKSGKSRA